MGIFFFQIFFIIFSIVAVGNVWRRRKDGSLGFKGIIFWTLFWLAADVAVLVPESTTIIANHFGIGRGTDFVLYVALAMIFYILFKLHVKIESVGRDVTKVIRRDALEESAKRKT